MFNNKKLKRLEGKMDTLFDEVIELREIIESVFPSEDTLSVLEGSEGEMVIPEEIYDEIYKYCENKNFIFMGVS